LISLKQKVGHANRGEYITGFSQRKRLLASLFFSGEPSSGRRCKLFPRTSQRRIDENFCFE
jgi:hypothetical protein